jgi:hypothetical protein
VGDDKQIHASHQADTRPPLRAREGREVRERVRGSVRVWREVEKGASGRERERDVEIQASRRCLLKTRAREKRKRRQKNEK